MYNVMVSKLSSSELDGSTKLLSAFSNDSLSSSSTSSKIYNHLLTTAPSYLKPDTHIVHVFEGLRDAAIRMAMEQARQDSSLSKCMQTISYR